MVLFFTITGVKVNETNRFTWMLAKCLWNAYYNAPYAVKFSNGAYSTTVKTNALNAFGMAYKWNGLGDVSNVFNENTRDQNVGGWTDYLRSIQTYSEDAQAYKVIEKKETANTLKAEKVGDYIYIGPLKVSYANKGINKIKIWTNKSNSLECKSGNGTIQWSTDKTNWKNNFNGEGGIPSNRAFYLRVKANPSGSVNFTDSTKLKIKAYQESVTYYRARLLLTGQDINKSQQIGIFASDEEKSYGGNVSWSVGVINEFDIEISKKSNLGNKLNGAKFIFGVYEGDVFKGWLKKKDDGTFSYGDTYYSGNNKFKVADGELKLEKLSTAYKYKVYECEAAAGCISLSKQIKKGMTVEIDGKPVKIKKTSSQGVNDLIYCGTINNKTEDTIKIDVVNIEASLNITINKIDNAGETLSGAKFVIALFEKDTRGNEVFYGWLRNDYLDGNYENKSDFTSNVKHTTDAKGKIKLTNLKSKYIYKVYEIEVPDGAYSLSEQIGKGMTIAINGNKFNDIRYVSSIPNKDVAGIYCGTVKYDSSNEETKFTLDIENQKPMKITIEKVDEVTGKPIPGVSFKFRVKERVNGDLINIGWLQTNKGITTSVDDVNTAWKTNASGKLVIEDLNPKYTYGIWESSVPEGCLELNKQIEAGMKVYKNEVEMDEVAYNSSWNMIYCCTARSSESTDTKVKVTNVKSTELVNIEINKKDQDGKSVSGAIFKILVRRSDGNKWLGGTEGNYQYLSNNGDGFRAATQWKVEGGTISIKGLPISDSYVIYEVQEGDGCISLSEQIAAGMKVNNQLLDASAYDSTKKWIKCYEFSPDATSNKVQRIRINVTNIKRTVNLTINKKDDEGNNITGAVFKIFAIGEGWIGKTGGDYVVHENTLYGFYEASSWEVRNGAVSINGLPGDKSYRIYEIKAGNGCLPLSEQIAAGMKVSGNVLEASAYNAAWDYINNDGNYEWIECAEIPVNSDADVTIEMINISSKVDLTINKKDDEGNPGVGAKFKVFIKSKGSTTIEKWLKGTEGNYIYNESGVNNAREFTTDSNGNIVIPGLSKKYKYSIYETKEANNCLPLNDQIESGMTVKVDGNNSTPVYSSNFKNSSGQYILKCCEVDYSADSSSSNKKVTIEVKNRKPKLNLKISKNDDEGNIGTGAQFKIKVYKGTTDKGWLRESSGNYTYEGGTTSNAKVWTMNNGVLQINGLSKSYKYEIYETKEADKCLPLSQQIAEGMQVNGSSITNDKYDVTNNMIKCITINPDSNSSNQAVTIQITNKRPKINITINKKDDEGKLGEGAQFKIKVYQGSTEKGWLRHASGNYIYEGGTISNAKVWTINNGVLQINGLSKSYKYEIYEIKEATGCLPLNQQAAQGMTVDGTKITSNEYDSANNMIKCKTINPDSNSSNQAVTIQITNKRPKINITINKKDEVGGNLNGAIFKILVRTKTGNYWLGGTEGNYQYLIDRREGYDAATSWKVVNGSVSINGLSKDNSYVLYEVMKADYCLSLSEQLKAGMSVDGVKLNESDFEDDYMWNKYGAVECKAIEANNNNLNQPVSLSIVNIEDYLDISGMIWEDWRGTKTDSYDSKYSEGSADKLYNEQVKITLMDSAGNEVRTATTTNGRYKITTPITVATSMNYSQVQAKLNGYYLKFEYTSGLTEANSKISYYATVAPSADANGSKAIPNRSDSNINGKAYIYKLSEYVNSTNYVCIRETSTHELQNMNMGLVKIENSYDYNINQTLAYVKVVINGYTYTYEYGGTANIAATAAPKVQYDNGWAYTRPIYPSDIEYSKANGWNDSSLKVYVVYRIDIKDIDPEGNANLTKAETKKQVSYVEVDLKVDSLTNSYDTNRYELEKNYDKSTNGDFDDWDNNVSTGVATYKGTKLNNTIKANETKTIYIQFKVKDSALEDLLTKGTTYERKATIATATAYHNYWKSYFAWNNSKEPTLVKEDKTTAKVTKNADSIYLKLQLGTERTITGKVFEDNKVSTNGEALGNGKYDSGENKIVNVKVDLLLEDKTTIATLYKKNGANYDESPATTKTNADGTYSLNGVTPGKYYVRFTYGDGTYSIADYKSTIVTENNIKTALKTGDENWYKKVSDIEHSTAVDNLEQRGQYNADTTSISTIEANTALTSIGVENDNEGDYVSVIVTDSLDGHKETINCINLGIIKQPKVAIESDKVVTYIKIINTQGNIIAEGNPATQNIKYVSDLDREDHLTQGSTYVKVEINENELYGSTLEIQYSITVQNKSDVNYYEDKTSSKYGYYYKFGEKTSDAKEVTYKADVVYDYVDSAVKSESVKLVSEPPYVVDIVSMSAANNKEKELVKNVKDNITGCDYEYLIKITGWNKDLKTIKTQKADGSQKYTTEDTKEVVDFKVSRLLSAEDDDLVVSNVAQVANFKKPDSQLVPQPEPQEPSDEVIVTVIPPTGEDTLTTFVYIITTVIAGAVIVLGVIIIKKKVLNK